MPDQDRNSQPNPTRLQDVVLPRPEPASRLVDDPDFAPAAFASEEAAVRDYVRNTAPIRSMPGGFDRRLRPWGYLIIAIWTGSLIGTALVRHFRRKNS